MKKKLRSEQPGNRPAGRPAPARPTRALRAHALLLTRSLTGRSRLSAPSSSLRRGFGELKHAIGELSASAVRRVSFPNLPRTHRHPLHPLSPILAPVATGTADGRLGRAHTGRSRRVEREVKGVTASVAHRDFNEARSSSGEARSEAGHGGGACGGTPAGVGEERLGLELR